MPGGGAVLPFGAILLSTRLQIKSSQIVHPAGFRERLRAARVASGVNPLGACKRRVECGLRALLGPLDRSRSRLAIKLRADRLRAMGPAFGLPTDRRTACSNDAISLVQGPAWADVVPSPDLSQSVDPQSVGINYSLMLSAPYSAPEMTFFLKN
jgi:hypothetical protein